MTETTETVRLRVGWFAITDSVVISDEETEDEVEVPRAEWIRFVAAVKAGLLDEPSKPAVAAPGRTAPDVVHLVGEEDDATACGLRGQIAFYWRKVTCQDCLDLIRAAEARRTAPGHRRRVVNGATAYERSSAIAVRCEYCCAGPGDPCSLNVPPYHAVRTHMLRVYAWRRVLVRAEIRRTLPARVTP